MMNNTIQACSFKQQNYILAEDQEEYNSLPAFIAGGKEGYVVTCYELSLWQAIKLLFTRKIWYTRLTFGTNYQPVLLETSTPFGNWMFIKDKNDETPCN